jgi:DNA-binding transcriptional LysR family regulator
VDQSLIRSDLKRIQWIDWFEANTLDPPPAPSMSFDRSFLALDAAVNGVGIAIESCVLARKELESGQLVKAFPAKPGPPTTLDTISPTRNPAASGAWRVFFADWLINDTSGETRL